MEKDLLIEIMAELLAEIRAMNADKRLWSMSDIAYYLNRSYSTVANRYVADPSFPAPIKLLGTGDSLYRPKEVKAWVDKQQVKNPVHRRRQ